MVIMELVNLEGAALDISQQRGEITSFTVSWNSFTKQLTMDHDHVSGSDALHFNSNTMLLAALAPSALTYIGNIIVTGNPLLAS